MDIYNKLQHQRQQSSEYQINLPDTQRLADERECTSGQSNVTSKMRRLENEKTIGGETRLPQTLP